MIHIPDFAEKTILSHHMLDLHSTWLEILQTRYNFISFMTPSLVYWVFEERRNMLANLYCRLPSTFAYSRANELHVRSGSMRNVIMIEMQETFYLVYDFLMNVWKQGFICDSFILYLETWRFSDGGYWTKPITYYWLLFQTIHFVLFTFKV